MIIFYYLLINCSIKLLEPKVSPATFCRVFPFHLMFNRDLRIVQTGCTITRVIPSVTTGNCKLSDILLTVSFNCFIYFHKIIFFFIFILFIFISFLNCSQLYYYFPSWDFLLILIQSFYSTNAIAFLYKFLFIFSLQSTIRKSIEILSVK